MKKVKFQSAGLDLVGDLYLPVNHEEGKKISSDSNFGTNDLP